MRVTSAVALLTALALLASGSVLAQQQPPTTSPQTSPPPPQSAPPLAQRVFYGGWVGLSFGDVDYVELAPLVGINVSPRVGVGASLLYRYRSDDRYGQDLDTSDYGASAFVRGRLFGGLFAQAEYEYLNYEYILYDLSSERDRDSSVLAGFGFSQAVGRSVGAYVLALYNFSYDDNDLYNAYDSPWVIRAGVGVGF